MIAGVVDHLLLKLCKLFIDCRNPYFQVIKDRFLDVCFQKRNDGVPSCVGIVDRCDDCPLENFFFYRPCRTVKVHLSLENSADASPDCGFAASVVPFHSAVNVSAVSAEHHAGKSVLTAVIALLACGVRIYELLHFKHEDFHRTESGAYLIGGCKTEAGRNRIIPILDFGIPVFEHAYATSVENGPLFPNGKGGFWNEKNWRNRKFYPFLEEIGIQPNPYDENGKRKPEFAGKLATYTPYTTRHTYASLCDRAGVNKDILKRAVGHTPKSKTLDEVYLHPKATQMIEAFDKANQLVNNEVLTTTKV